MTPGQLHETKTAYGISSDMEATNAIEFVMDLLQAQKDHLANTQPWAVSLMHRLDFAQDEVRQLLGGLENVISNAAPANTAAKTQSGNPKIRLLREGY